MGKTEIKYLTLSQEDLIEAGAFDLQMAMKALKEGLVKFKDNRILFPDKIVQIFNEETQERINCLPATLLDEKICGVKWVSVFPPNPRRFGVQNLSAIIVLSEIEKGFPVCVMDGTLCSNMRVAAMGATAADVLAKKDAESIGFIGAGEQAKMHLLGMKAVRPGLKVCKVAAVSTAEEEAFIRDLGFHQIDEILDACHQKGIFGEMEAGRATRDEFRSYVLERSEAGHQPEEVDKALWNILVGITPEKVELLKRLSQKYDLYMLSNNNPICTPKAAEIFAEAGYPMYEGFVKCYISYQMKTLKPSAEFYKAVMADIGLPSEDMLFVDDSQRNVDGAIAAGLPAVYYEPGTDLGRVLADALGDSSILGQEVAE